MTAASIVSIALISIASAQSDPFSAPPKSSPAQKSASAQSDLTAYLAAGRSMARQSFFANAGVIHSNTAGRRVYSAPGPLLGLSVDQAISKFVNMWAASSGQTKQGWAAKAKASGSSSEGESDTAFAAAIKEADASYVASRRASLDQSRRDNDIREIKQKLDTLTR